MRPLAVAFGEVDEVGYGDGSVFREEADGDLAFCGVEDGVRAGSKRHRDNSYGFRCAARKNADDTLVDGTRELVGWWLGSRRGSRAWGRALSWSSIGVWRHRLPFRDDGYLAQDNRRQRLVVWIAL